MANGMSSDLLLHTLRIDERPPRTWFRTFKAVLFCIVFNVACLTINCSQFILLPLRILPFRETRKLYDAGIRYTKGAFGCLQILMCQWFAPTKLKISFETQGLGSFTPEQINRYVIRDTDGKVIALNFPTKFVLIANHQIYADWWYAWCLTYFLSPHGIHQYVYITLKKSLRWVPIVGWGMQFFNFIFLARSWASDRQQLATDLTSLGREAEREGKPLCFMLYPEGTLVSRKTRPQSKKFADKMGISDMKNLLLPRSTGLHYSLRSLASRIPDLRLLDMTVIYPGIPPLHYGQDYYTLRSIFFDGIAPPEIHVHFRIFEVTGNVPIGDLSGISGAKTPDSKANTVEVDIPNHEKNVFDIWLRKLWTEKDESVDNFFNTGLFDSATTNVTTVEIPLKLHRTKEILDAFCFFWPGGIAYLWRKMKG